MSLIILGVNKFHNSSVALTIDNELIFHIESERLSGRKRDPLPFQAISMIKKYVDHIDILAISGLTATTEFDMFRGIDAYAAQVLSLGKSFYDHGIDIYDFSFQHHESHAYTAFYNSGFDSALCVVKDGAGSQYLFEEGSKYADIYAREVNSAFIMSYPSNIELIRKQISFPYHQTIKKDWINDRVFASTALGEGLAFEAMCLKMGFHAMDGGKIMGLASYGKENDSIPPIYVDGIINQKIFKYDGFDDTTRVLDFDLKDDFQLSADFAYALQKSVENNVIGEILELLERTGQKNLCLSGGLFLNCVMNYELLKSLPKGVNLYVEPASGDGGNSIGVARHVYHYITGSKKKNVQKSLYLGPRYNLSIDDIDFPQDKINSSSAAEVAKLISEKNIVAIFQGRSEAGPRALGNRSILYDPRDPDGKDHVNTVKKREWFRPFAGSILEDKASEWFDLHSLNDSKFMMFAVDVKINKRELIPAITHIDGTCRVQTVSKTDNPHYHELISEFDKITGVPIIFNTSFNLAGDPLVETIEDAIRTLKNSSIDYLYLPELGILLDNSEN